MDFINLKSLIIPEGEVSQITCDGVILWKSGYKNWVKYSTETDDKTIYNGGLGYKDRYCIRSGGAEQDHGSASHTGFIRATGGDIVRLSGYDIKRADTGNAINVYNSSHTNLGQIVGNSGGYGIFSNTNISWNDVTLEKEGVYYWVIPEDYNIEYIRVTGYTGADGSKMIVTINEEIE